MVRCARGNALRTKTLNGCMTTGRLPFVVIREDKTYWWEVYMSEEDLELLITTDDPGEDSLDEDTFHQGDNATARPSGQAQQGGDGIGKRK